MRRPRLLDAYCGQGGTSMGYSRAGFDVFGVDIEPWPFYPFEQVQGDAITFIREHGHEYDAIHASPPCQRFSLIGNAKSYVREDYPDLIGPTIEALREVGKPWVLENVPRAPGAYGVLLCGSMFEGIRFARHRYFMGEGWPFPAMAPATCNHDLLHPGHYYKNWGRDIAPKWADAGRIFLDGLGLDWVPAPTGGGWLGRSQGGVIEGVPPPFAEWIGRQLITTLQDTGVAR